MKHKLIIFSISLLCAFGTFAQQKSSKKFDLGRKQFDNKDYTGAVKTFSEVIETDSSNASAYFNRALAEIELEQLEKALVDIQKFHSLKPDDPDGMNYISYLYLQLKDYENLIKSIQEFMPKGSTEYNSNLYLGKAYYKLGNSQQALEYLNYHLQLEPENELALYTRAQVYVMLDQFKEAETDFSKLIILNPRHNEAYYIRAMIKSERKDYWAALEDLNKSIDIVPEYVAAYTLRGDIYTGLTKPDKAKQDYEKAIELSKGEDLSAIYALGTLMMTDLSDFNGALKQFNLVLTKDTEGEYNESYFLRGVINTRLENYKAAEEDFNKYDGSDISISNELNYYRAELKYNMGEYDQAIQLLEQYLLKTTDLEDSDYGAVYKLNGKILIAQKKFDKAMTLIEKSIGYDAKDGETWYWKGILLKNMKQKEKACDAFKKAFELEYNKAETELKELCGYTGSVGDEPSDSLVG